MLNIPSNDAKVPSAKLSPTDLLTKFGNIGSAGTNVKILLDPSGKIVNDKIYFHLKNHEICWSKNKKHLKLTPFVLLLPGKITGMLACSPFATYFDDGVCLAIISKQEMVEIIFNSEEEHMIWFKGLQLLISQSAMQMTIILSPKSLKTRKMYENMGKRNIINDNRSVSVRDKKILENTNQREIEYSFFATAVKGDIFYRFTQKERPKFIRLKLKENGQKLICVDLEGDKNSLEMDLYCNLKITSDYKNKSDMKTYFENIDSKMYCFSILNVNVDQIVEEWHLGCQDKQQFDLWFNGLPEIFSKSGV